MKWSQSVENAVEKAKELDPNDPVRRGILEKAANAILALKKSRKKKQEIQLAKRNHKLMY